MTMETRMTTMSDGQVGIFNPEAQLGMAIAAAKALDKVIAQKKKPVMINGEQYLEFEDWQTLGQFDGVSVRTGEVEAVEIDGVKGAKAKAFLINNKTGEEIGGAEAYCMRDEAKWGMRAKYEYQDGNRVKVGDEPVPWHQLASMAQTRAGSKALRNKEAWIAVLAGYKTTPAEEMSGTETSGQPSGQPQTAEHWCAEHNTAYFKRGKMKSFAHPIGDTGEWCHEHTDKPAPKPAPQPEKPAEDLFPEGVPARSPSSIKTIGDLFNFCKDDFGLTKDQVLVILKKESQGDLTELPADCYFEVASKREKESALNN